MKTISYTLPAYWASALVNGDTSGLSDTEKNNIAAWRETVAQDISGDCLTCSDEPAFITRFHDAIEMYEGLITECLIYTFPASRDYVQRETVATFRANLAKAVRDGKPVDIGGGKFSLEELADVLAWIDARGVA